MEEKELYQFWQKHIEKKKIYRVFSSEYRKQIEKEGIHPKNNPYKKKYKQIKRLFKLLLWLEKKHQFNHTQDWGKKNPINSENLIKITLKDMKNKYLDFTPFKKEVKYYEILMQGNGGALISTIQKITKDILERNPKLPFWFSKKSVERLHEWTHQKGAFDIHILYISGKSYCLESAIFQNKINGRLQSPFGSFDHFKKVITEFGLEIYKPFFECNEWYNIRVGIPIPPKLIQFIQ